MEEWTPAGAGANILGSNRSRSRIQLLRSVQEPNKISKGPIKISGMRFVVVKLNEINGDVFSD